MFMCLLALENPLIDKSYPSIRFARKQPWIASFFTSFATMPNPRLCSPALAASIVACSANKYVDSATLTDSIYENSARNKLNITLAPNFCKATKTTEV